MENKILVVKLIKLNGRLVFKNKSDQTVFLKLQAGLREGQVIEQMTSFDKDDGTLGQLATVHAMIADIAKHMGETTSNIKVMVKKECGLFDLNGNVKSFGVCSKDELNDVKEQLIQMGEFLGLKLRR